jgi:menaquinone-dependent protoporphyrinogen oxidase
MNVLIAYASKHGSTEDIAVAIADALTACGLRAECIEASHVHSLEPYDAVVLGSAVYMRRWRPEARRFLRRHAHALVRRPFWAFSSGPVGDPAKDNPAWNEPPRTIAKVVDLGAREHKVFGGVAQGGLAKSVAPEFLDRRDWDEIRAWAQHIAAGLRVAAG